ncbi:MAG: galactokinase [Candidatus Bipolaricaulota bacterium]|nr:galactokinase [Candidatus Bipolaricaulota bacterium]
MTQASQDSLALLENQFGPGVKAITARAPGRVNLIGEHTDYNGGYVLPFAIDRKTVVTVRPRRDQLLRVYAAAFDETIEMVLPLVNPAPTGSWSDYLIGILLEFQHRSALPFGFDEVITGNVPLEAGLSSSASLEIALTLSLSHLYDIELTDLELIKLCQRAENGFVGTQSGIMDQYASLLARDNSALLLDTTLLQHRYIPLDVRDASLLIVDSGVRRSLACSGYNERRGECQEALRLLQERMPKRGIRSLSDLKPDELERLEVALPRTLVMRARHVVEENARVLDTVNALQRDDFVTVGKLLFASHASLRDLFQVSTEELDFLVDWAREHGALGARLVGGGFGGVTLHLVPKDRAMEYAKEIATAYHAKFGLNATTIEVRPSAGAKELENR